MKYEHLFFDLDHTLWDFEANSRQTLAELYKTMDLPGKGVDDFEKLHNIYMTINERLWERYRNGFIKVEELRWKRMWLTLIEFKIGDEKLARTMGNLFLDMLPTRNILFPYTHEILEYLHGKKYRLHLITNGFQKTQQAKLLNAGLEKYFGKIITSEGSNSLKPHPEIFEYALRETRAEKEKSIMIGDSPEVDIQGAINAGIDQVFVNHLHIETELRPTYTVYSLKELEDIF